MTIIYLLLLLLFAIIARQDFLFSVLIITALLPSYLIRFSVFGIPTTLLEGMILIIIAIWIWKNRLSILNAFHVPKQWQIVLTLFLISATIGLFIFPDHRSAFGIWKAYYIEPIVLFFIILDVLKQPNTKEKIYRALGISALGVALFAIIQWVFQIGIPIPWDIERRVTSVFEYPNALSLFLGPIIVLSWFEFFRERQKTHTHFQWFWLTINIFGFIAIILAQSEAAIAALVLTAFLILVSQKKTRLYLSGFFIIGSIILFSLPLTQKYLIQKFTFQDSSEQVRLSQWKETINLLRDHPMFGVGLSGYPIALKPYHRALQYEIFQYPHNLILNIWVELGILGLVAFVWLVVLILSVMMSGRGMPHPYTPIFFVFFEMTVHGFFDVPYFKNDLAVMTWILLAIFLFESISQKTKHSNS